VDVDGKNNPWLQTVNYAELTAGAVSRTPRGGLHFWFRQNGGEPLKNTASRIAEQVDTRADGGYVVVWPSVVDDCGYQWLEPLVYGREQLPTLPQWIADSIHEQQTATLQDVAEEIPAGQRNGTLTRYAGGLRRLGLSVEEIYQSLSGINTARCQPPLAERELRKIANSALRWEADIIATSLIHDHLAPEPQESNDEECGVPQFPQFCLDNLPWLMRLAYDYALATAKKPQPELTVGALISLFGTLFGRKVRDDYDTRTNVMVLGLSPSGTGKEHPRQINKQILVNCRLERLSGPERLGSHAGLVTAVHAEPSRLFQLDEIGRLLATMRDAGRNPHLYNIGTVLMQMYSSSNIIWTADAYADWSKVKTINQPCVCVFGTAVPENFYGSLTYDNLSDGMLARLIVIEGRKDVGRQKPMPYGFPMELSVPINIWMFGSPEGGNLQQVIPEADPGVLLIRKSDEADAKHEWYCAEVNQRHEREDDVRRAIWSRAPEKAAKLALIHACCDCQSCDIADVQITAKSVEWGIKLANYSTRLVLHNSSNNVSSSRYEHDKKRLWRKMPDETTLSELTRKTQWLRPADRVLMLKDLEESGAISVVIETTGKATKRLIRKRRSSL
jgi:hypothetical protein